MAFKINKKTNTQSFNGFFVLQYSNTYRGIIFFHKSIAECKHSGKNSLEYYVESFF